VTEFWLCSCACCLDVVVETVMCDGVMGVLL